MANLNVVMYHYVRNLPQTRYPRIKGMMVDKFRDQVRWLASNFEMVNLEGALVFLKGQYKPKRDLCLLTFDDGLKEHSTEVVPILAELKIQGLFGIITSCVNEHRVAAVHMNHFLTAALNFAEYRHALFGEMESLSPGLMERTRFDADVAQHTYPLDTREMAAFKYQVNFAAPKDIGDQAIRRLFARYMGDEAQFSKELYMNWAEVLGLQSAGMLVAGHTHWHRPLATLTPAELAQDIETCRALLAANLRPQVLWPFSYPYGKRNAYSKKVISQLKSSRFDCAFNTESGVNSAGKPIFEINRIDCKGAIGVLRHRLAA
ncbi:MAG: polysaccharide deacetylase [Bryobacterales bacterium]|nr:polysaccharide deacetylase [Bryobacterales bacterium]